MSTSVDPRLHVTDAAAGYTHVVHPPTMVMAPQAAPAALEAAEEVLEQLRSEVQRGSAWVGMDVEFRTAYGNPYGELLKLAEEVRAEHVVLGASEALGHRVVGSLGARMIKAGRWPVTVVP